MRLPELLITCARFFALPIGVGLLLIGCHSVGPLTVARDRLDYSDAVAESWKRQTLRNIVKLRYFDPPIFVDVGQIVSGYSLETGISVMEKTAGPNDYLKWTPSASSTFTDRPTITYTPLTGSQFVNSMMTPVPPESVFAAIQSGWAADTVLLITLSEINGLKNAHATSAGAVQASADFLRVVTLFLHMQAAQAIELHSRKEASGERITTLSFRADSVAPETRAELLELRALLRLEPELSEFRLIFGGRAHNKGEIALLTRSIVQQMYALADGVIVPSEHEAEGRASPRRHTTDDTHAPSNLIRIHSGTDTPDNEYVGINYRNHWFWIDDRDLMSKRTFAFMMMLFTLADSGQANGPVITIPAN
jgi:hypothetical protein